ncbi:hypothetical protein [Noviherbaspirillum saxi]|uniref:Uncharacterized protein n=1 Tax=Noviherbaspirillum saxi TaxID=2320863 RepID=A0A3A3FWP2_9BURK|nr:hypothetical protein [Noviherbaspirillum saxi]RJF99058.1 hypothetical protein D3871_11440 [Noviherbaspirillum saxi]
MNKPWTKREHANGIAIVAGDLNSANVIAREVRAEHADLIAAAPDLLAELLAAEKIILAMLNVMTLEQKAQVHAKLDKDGVANEGMTRYHERRKALAKAGAV